ncbi:MAG: YHS domain-containing protein [Chloroflexi bacterium]|nr:YHS domain-containing protein [Chloroflexota bacterium]MBI3762553.1 YHS domain-containing protein [Chloroflexota bacterium]
MNAGEETMPLAPDEALTVCGGRIKPDETTPQAEWRDRRLYFCARACLRAFEGDPERFLAGEIEHPTDDD